MTTAAVEYLRYEEVTPHFKVQLYKLRKLALLAMLTDCSINAYKMFIIVFLYSYFILV